MREISHLIKMTKKWREYHRSRGRLGQIEVLACNIRIKALEDARAALKDARHD